MAFGQLTLLYMSSSGKSAEFYAAAELARNGWNVVYLGGNFRDSDLCIEDTASDRVLWIQVKSYEEGNQKVILKKPQVLRWVGADKWYIFVGIPKNNLDKPPAHFYCLPSKEVHEHAVFSSKQFVDAGGRDTDFWGFNMKDYVSKARGLLIAAHSAERLIKADRNFKFYLNT